MNDPKYASDLDQFIAENTFACLLLVAAILLAVLTVLGWIVDRLRK